MILLLDTSTPTCVLIFVDDTEERTTFEWKADRELAKGLLSFINESLQKIDKSWHDVTAIGVYEGPGSFTGLRIGLTVANTLADSEHIPIVGARGEDWHETALSRLENKENDQLVMPFYGSEAHITSPRK